MITLHQLKQKGDRLMKLGDRTPSTQTKRRSHGEAGRSHFILSNKREIAN
ncbi:hypothetical protein [Calothrix sp. NIES-2100]